MVVVNSSGIVAMAPAFSMPWWSCSCDQKLLVPETKAAAALVFMGTVWMMLSFPLVKLKSGSWSQGQAAIKKHRFLLR